MYRNLYRHLIASTAAATRNKVHSSKTSLNTIWNISPPQGSQFRFVHLNQCYCADVTDTDSEKTMSLKCENIWQYVRMEWPRNNKHEPLKRDMVEKISVALLGIHAQEQMIGKMFLENPKLLQRPIGQIIDCVETLKEYGFNSGQIVKIILQFYIHIPDKVSLSNVVNTIRSFGFNDDEIPKILTNSPQLFLLGENELVNRYCNLQMLFPMTALKTMIFYSPNLLLESVDCTHEKYDYIVDEMGLNDKDISHSNVFDHSLQHIRARHTILVRAGLYEKPKPDGTTRNILNQRLRKIVDTSDSVFAAKIVGIKLEDYVCFKDVLAVEVDRNSYQYDRDDDSYKR